MSQPRGVSPASEVPGSPSGVPPSPPPAAFLGQSVIPLVNKLQDIFSQLGSASTIDLPQVRFFDVLRSLAECQVNHLGVIFTGPESRPILGLRAPCCSCHA